jgi:hypothetical protein
MYGLITYIIKAPSARCELKSVIQSFITVDMQTQATIPWCYLNATREPSFNNIPGNVFFLFGIPLEGSTEIFQNVSLHDIALHTAVE